MSSKRALCVGIDRYAPPNALGGCVNDAKLWAKTLSDLGFESEIITDANATRTKMLNALRKLVRGGKEDDVLVFQYSGHGTQVNDLDGDEEDDGLDEALCPVDIDRGAFLIDDDLWDVFGGLADGVNLTVVLDCCHSGTSTRALGSFRPTAAPAPDARRRFIPWSRERDAAHEKYRKRLRATRATRPVGSMKWVNFSACQPEEVAWEHGGQGDFTRHGTAVLSGGAAGLTNEEFQRRVVAQFGPNPAQRPYLDCTDEARRQGLFGSVSGRSVAAMATGAAGATRHDVASVLESLARLLRSGG